MKHCLLKINKYNIKRYSFYVILILSGIVSDLYIQLGTGILFYILSVYILLYYYLQDINNSNMNRLDR